MAMDTSYNQAVLGDASLYLHKDEWFALLQDGGRAMTEAEMPLFDGSKKKKSGHIAHGQRFYKDIYTLAGKLHDVYSESDAPPNDRKFTGLPKNRSTWAHQMGKYVCEQRRKLTRGDIHNTTDAEFLEQVNSEAQAKTNEFYVLSQAAILQFVQTKWGRSQATLMEPTPDDKARLMGIILADEDVRCFVSDLTMKSKAGTAKKGKTSGRRTLDASNPRRLAAIKVAHNKFIDAEVRVALPEKWTDSATQAMIDKFRGEGFYAEHGTFDPNNEERIKLPWTEKQIESMFGDVQKEYNRMMHKYTAGTGGGSGDDANYVVWEERDPANAARYSEQGPLLYLTVVVMWDKQFSWVFVTVKDPLPPGCRVEDGSDEEEDGGVTTPKPDKGEQKLVAAISDLSKDRALRHTEMMEVLRGNAGPDGKLGQQQNLLQLIGDTRTQIAGVQAEVKELKRKKVAIELKDAPKEEKKVKKRAKKLKSLSAEINQQKSLVSTLKKTMEQHRLALEKVNQEGTERAEDDSADEESDSDSGASSGSSEDSDSD